MGGKLTNAIRHLEYVTYDLQSHGAVSQGSNEVAEGMVESVGVLGLESSREVKVQGSRVSPGRVQYSGA